jgi:hypothetical protein
MERLAFCVVVSLFVLQGCTTTTSHLSTGKALSPGDYQITGSYTLPVHTVLFSKTLESARQLEDLYEGGTEKMTEEEARELLDTALTWALFASAGAPEMLARVGIADSPLEGMDVGIRYNGSTLKGDLQWQLLESSDRRWFLAVDLGYAYQFDVVSSALSSVALTDWSRHDLDGSVTLGYAAGDFFKAWLAPRFLYSFVKAEPKFDQAFTDALPESITESYLPSEYFRDQELAYYGATVGMMLGYRWLFATLELTVMGLRFRPEVLGETRDFDGVLVAPGVGFTFLWQ